MAALARVPGPKALAAVLSPKRCTTGPLMMSMGVAVPVVVWMPYRLNAGSATAAVAAIKTLKSPGRQPAMIGTRGQSSHRRLSSHRRQARHHLQRVSFPNHCRHAPLGGRHDRQAVRNAQSVQQVVYVLKGRRRVNVQTFQIQH